MTVECDVVVLGLGPGGEYVASELAGAGLDVVAVEERLVGGECPYFGCIPTKMMIAAADSLREARRVDTLAGRAAVEADWTPVATRIRDEATDDWDDEVAAKRLTDAGATLVRGRGVITARGEVTVGDETYVARKGVVVNTGTEPAVPPIDGLADTPYWTNREVVQLTELPGSVIVIGGGPIGAEMAQVLARFGVRVTVVEVADRIIAPEEPEASAMLAAVFAEDGMQVLTGAEIESVAYADGTFTVVLADQTITADKLLVAAGRRLHIAGIGLAAYGVDETARSVEVDDHLRAADGLWVIGDITGKGAFTHISMYQGEIVVRDLLGQDGPWADYHAVARATYTMPEVGSVGMSEQQARDAGLDVRTSSQEGLGSRGWITEEKGLIKVVADAGTGVLVGATVVGPGGGEIMSALVTAVHARVPVSVLRTMHYAFPTYYRAIKPVLDDLDLS